MANGYDGYDAGRTPQDRNTAKKAKKVKGKQKLTLDEEQSSEDEGSDESMAWEPESDAGEASNLEDIGDLAEVIDWTSHRRPSTACLPILADPVPLDIQTQSI